MLFLMSFAVNAENPDNPEWKYVGLSDDFLNSIHLPSIKETTDKTGARYVEFWLSFIFFDPSKFSGIDETKWRVVMDCTERSYSIYNVISYDVNGKPVKSYISKTRHDPIIPDSIMETAYNFVCK